MAALMIPALVAWPTPTITVEGPALAIALTAFAMTGGALMAGRRLLPVLAEEVSTMTPVTGLFANTGTAILVLGATHSSATKRLTPSAARVRELGICHDNDLA
jgi:PiT family inorganic phosphate transporter